MARNQPTTDFNQKLNEISVELFDLLNIYSTQASVIEPTSLSYMTEKEFQTLYNAKAQNVKSTMEQWLKDEKTSPDSNMAEKMWATYADIYESSPKEAKNIIFVPEALKSQIFIFKNLGDIDVFCKLEKKERDNSTLIKAVFNSLDKMTSFTPQITKEDDKLSQVAEEIWSKLPDRIKKPENTHREIAFSAYFTRQNPNARFDELDEIIPTYHECIETKNKKAIESIYSKCSDEVKKALDLAYVGDFNLLSKESRSNPDNFKRAIRRDLNNLIFVPSSVLCKDSNQEVVLPEVIKKFTSNTFSENNIRPEAMDKITALPAIAYSPHGCSNLTPNEIVKISCDEFPTLKKMVDSTYTQSTSYKGQKTRPRP